MDPIRSAAAFSDAQSVLDWVVRDLSLASPRTFFLGCIYRSYPALEMGLSAGCRDGHLVDVRGLHEAFCQSPTFFDRWVVESRQRNRWQDYTQIDIPAPLRQFWKLKTFNSFRRIVLCNGSRPMAYLSADLPPGSTWTHAELSGIDARYRQSSNALRLAALAWRARQAGAPPDAGAPDAGSPESIPDAGPGERVRPVGCGCSSGPAQGFWLFGLAALARLVAEKRGSRSCGAAASATTDKVRTTFAGIHAALEVSSFFPGRPPSASARALPRAHRPARG